ncbi:DDE-type integrase/transposase/recombinase [Patescibacteria group bacterium]|nr:DDE-type integrase/transposase/recombinase [Patescibacteria group bacterium]
MKDKKEQEALFWCTLLKPIIFDELPNGSKTKFLEELSEKEHVMPDGKIKKASLSTLKRKVKKYKEKGFKGLERKKRSDIGKIRVVPEEVIQTAIEIKKDQPYRSEYVINDLLQDRYNLNIKRSTLYRHLKIAGATKMKLGLSKKKVRKRWTRNHTHSLWVGDFAYGPSVLEGQEWKKTYLSAFIDCHSRYAVSARYYFRQSYDVLVDTLLRAWNIHGMSKQLYLDNGKVYHANGLKKACFDMGIDLLHRPVRDPASGGLIEKFILSVQNGFESEVRASHPMTLEQLNTSFNAWLEMAYHKRIHSETAETPEQRYAQGLIAIVRVDVQKIINFFMARCNRFVDPNYSDVRVNNNYYRVNPSLRGDKVQVLTNPFDNDQNVLIYSEDETFLGEGILYKREYGEPLEEYKSEKAKHDYLGYLVSKHQKQLDKSIDYRQLDTKKWSFNLFVQTLARYLGRKGGISAFNSNEHEELWKVWQHSKFNEAIVVKAWQETYPKNFKQFIAHINNILT